MKKELKIVKRLCKEAGIFPGKYYINIMKYIEIHNSYVFYGLDGGSYSRNGVEYEIKFLKLQFDILKSLIDNNLLEEKDYILVINDTLTRYKINNLVNTPWYENWKRVVKETGKKEFVGYFFDAFEKNVGELTKNRKNDILCGLPRD